MASANPSTTTEPTRTSTEGKRPREFRTRTVARLVGLSPARVRALARARICEPSRVGREYRFSFQDVIALRTAAGLIAQQIPLGQVRSALHALQKQLPADRPLTGVRLVAGPGGIVVRDGSRHWRPTSGQGVFSFLVDDLARQSRAAAAPAIHNVAASEPLPGRSADDWFERALILEQEGKIPEAQSAYELALRLEPAMGDAHVNLGRLIHQSGDAVRAAAHYEAAIACDHEDPVAHYNLALACEDQQNWEGAVQQYRRAIAISPEFADAHFNIGQLLDRLGKWNEAVRHMTTYNRLIRRR